MTNETEAPERIWAWIDYDGNWDGTWIADCKTMQPEILPSAEYVHAGLSDAQAKRIAELEAELYAMTEDRNIVLETSQQQFIRIEELEAQNRELHMQVIASDGQAQMAYEEQEKLEAKLAKLEHDPRCAKCGHPKSNHPYRHPFQELKGTD